MKKIFTAAIIFCAAMIFFGAKSFAAEFELVSYSAHVKLQWLANAGVPEAKKILSQIGTANIFAKDNLQDYDRLEKVNGIFQELSYASTLNYFNEKNYTGMFDIGGGYTPRAYFVAKEGKKYVGAELTAVAMSASEIMQKVLDANSYKNILYENVPVADKEAMLGTADTLKGEICIVENGLMMYLPPQAVDAMYTFSHEILKKHGGCYITSDFVAHELFTDIAEALYGEHDKEILYDETMTMYENLFGDEICNDTFETKEDAKKFLAAHGFKVEEVPLLTDVSKLHCLKNLTPEQAEKIKQIAAKKYLWVITTAN